jgi:hypothetical protein
MFLDERHGCGGMASVRPKRGLDFVEVLATVVAAYGVERAVRVAGRHPIRRELGHARVRLLSDPKGELRSVSRLDRVDQRTGRIVQPVTLGLVILRTERFAAVDLVCKEQDADVPEREVAENTRNGPVLVHGSGERVVIQPFDERAQTLPFTVVDSDV